MRHLATVIVASAAVLLTVSACGKPSAGTGSPGNGPTGAPTSQSPTSTPAIPPTTSSDPDPGSAPKPPAGATAVPKTQVDPKALPEGYPRLVWTVGDGTTVGANGQEGGCSKVRAEVTAQDAQQVKITFVETSPAKQQACTMDIRYPELTVKLEKPLGSRTVVLAERDELK